MGEKVARPTVAVVIVAFNDPANIKRLLQSLAKTRGAFTLETVVVDNSISNALANDIGSIVGKAPTALHASYHRQKGNLGFAGGVNAGLQAAHPDYYWLINSDTTVAPDAISHLLTTAQTTQAAAVGSLILYADDKTVYYGGGTANDWLGIVRHPGRNRPPQPHDATRPISFINGCAMFLPAATIKKYGALFTPYFMYYEETDLCARIRRGGETLYYEPDSIVYHFTPHTDDKSPLSVYFLTRNHWLYVARNLNFLQQITARLAITGFQLYRFLHYLRQPTLRQAIVAGWRDALRHHYGPKPN